MKLPRCDIYWNCIAKSFLTIEDMATMELSINNHHSRDSLLFSQPFSDSIPIFMNPYESMLVLDVNQKYDLISECMKYWCEKRHLKIPHLNLCYKVTTSTTDTNQTYKSWELFHYVRRLNSMTKITEVIPHLYSLESFNFYLENIDEHLYGLRDYDLKSLINRCLLNQSRSEEISPGPHILTEVSLALHNTKNTEQIKFLLEEFIVSFPIIERAQIIYFMNILPSHYKLIATHWSRLRHLHIVQVSIKEIEIFQTSNQRFQCLKIQTCPVDASIISKLLTNSKSTLEMLYLFQIPIEFESDLTPIISSYPNLKELRISLSLYYIYGKSFSNEMLLMIGNHLHNLEDLHLYGDNHNITMKGIHCLVSGCPRLRFLVLDRCYMITRKDINFILQAYEKNLEVFSMKILKRRGSYFERFSYEHVNIRKKQGIDTRLEIWKDLDSSYF